MNTLKLRDKFGQRKYLTPQERKLFFRSLDIFDNPADRYLCEVYYFTGCRFGEGLELTLNRIDLEGRALVIRTLKLKDQNVFRDIPCPLEWLRELHHYFRNVLKRDPDEPLFDISRRTASRRVRKVFDHLNMSGPYARVHGLRHGFGIAHAMQKTPLGILQKLLGHASIKSTMIYLDAVGNELQFFAKAVW